MYRSVARQKYWQNVDRYDVMVGHGAIMSNGIIGYVIPVGVDCQSCTWLRHPLIWVQHYQRALDCFNNKIL